MRRTSSRSGSIVFTQSESGKTVSVSVSQEGKPASKETVVLYVLESTTSNVTISASKPVKSALTITLKYTIRNDPSYTTYTATGTMAVNGTRCIISTPAGQLNTISNMTVSPTSDSTYNYSVGW